MKLRLIFLLLISAIALVIFQKADYDWDMPAYIGCVEQLKTNNSVEMHKNTYQLLEKKLSTAQYLKVTGTTPENTFRVAMKNSAADFQNQLPYYQIKSLYIAIIYIISLFTDCIQALFLLNYFCFLFSAFYISKIFLHFKVKDWLSYLLTFALMCLPASIYIASSPTPDLFAVAFLIYLIYCFVKKESFAYQVVIALLLLLSRPDYLPFILLYISVIWFFQKEKLGWYFISIFVLVGTYFLIIKVNEYHGWSSLIYDSFFRRRISMSESHDFKMTDYFSMVLKHFLNFKKITLLSTALFGIYWFLYRKTTQNRAEFFIVMLLYLSIYLRFIIFPAAGEVRFYYGFLLLLALFAIKNIYQLMDNKKPGKNSGY